jgi:hypothetical protein
MFILFHGLDNYFFVQDVKELRVFVFVLTRITFLINLLIASLDRSSFRRPKHELTRSQRINKHKRALSLSIPKIDRYVPYV